MKFTDDIIRTQMEERFGHDNVIAVATVSNGEPRVRFVDALYLDGSFYTVTYALSGKMQQIAADPAVAICGEWLTARGTGENLGYIRDEKNTEIAAALRKAFAAWYDNGHTDESDPNTCILRVRLLDGILFGNGERYEIEFN